MNINLANFITPEELEEMNEAAQALDREMDRVNTTTAKKFLDEAFPGNSFTLELHSRREEMMRAPRLYHRYFKVLNGGADTGVTIHSEASALPFMRLEDARFVHPRIKMRMSARTVSKRLTV